MLAAGAGIESVSTHEGQIIMRLFQGMQFTPQQQALRLPDGVRMGINQIRLNLKRLGNKWREVLEDTLNKMG